MEEFRNGAASHSPTSHNSAVILPSVIIMQNYALSHLPVYRMSPPHQVLLTNFQVAFQTRRGPEGEGDRPLRRRGGLPDALRRPLRAERQPAARAGQAPQGQVRERHGRQRGPGA